jgi:hypothetical protein
VISLNRFYTISFFTLLAVTQLCSLDAMKQTLDVSQKNLSFVPETQVIEILLCLDVNRVLPCEIDLLIIKQMVLLHVDRYFANDLDTTSPEKLRDFLTSICNNLPNFGHVSLSDHELGAFLAAHLAQRGTSLLTLVDEDKETVLHCAACRGNLLPRIRVIYIRVICMAAGADAQKLVEMQDNYGKTVLHYAACNGRTVTVQALLSVLAINAPPLVVMQDDDGETALHKATWNGHTAIVQALLSVPGIDAQKLVMMQNNNGKTALYLAEQCDRGKTVVLLRSYMNPSNQ